MPWYLIRSLYGNFEEVVECQTLEEAQAAAKAQADDRGFVKFPFNWKMTLGGEWNATFPTLTSPWWTIIEADEYKPRTRLRTDYQNGEMLGGEAGLIHLSLLRIAHAIKNPRAARRIAKFSLRPSNLPAIYFCILNQAAKRLPVELTAPPVRHDQWINALRYNAMCRDVNALLDYLDSKGIH